MFFSHIHPFLSPCPFGEAGLTVIPFPLRSIGARESPLLLGLSVVLTERAALFGRFVPAMGWAGIDSAHSMQGEGGKEGEREGLNKDVVSCSEKHYPPFFSAGLPKDEWAEFRRGVITTVLATDMANHFEHVSKFQARITTGVCAVCMCRGVSLGLCRCRWHFRVWVAGKGSGKWDGIPSILLPLCVVSIVFQAAVGIPIS